MAAAKTGTAPTGMKKVGFGKRLINRPAKTAKGTGQPGTRKGGKGGGG